MGSVLIAAAVVSFSVSLIATRALFSRHGLNFILDQPNTRSLHSVPTPRTGGVGIAIGASVAWLCLPGQEYPLLASLAAALAVLFLIEDAVGMPVIFRLAGQCIAAVVFLWSLDLLQWPLFLALALACVWSANSYNFMDGSDGLSGGMTVIGFGTYALAATASGHVGIAYFSSIIAAASLGFLYWNTAPARIFMGDTGAIPLGFLAAALGTVGWQAGAWPIWFPVLVFSVFGVDSTITLLNRATRGEPVWRAHCDHHFQRLIRMGWSHRKLAMAAYAIMLATAGSALSLRQAHPVVVLGILTAWMFAFAGIAMIINARWQSWMQHSAGANTANAETSAFAQ